MTAQVIALFPVGEDADDTVRRTARALMAFRDVSVELLAERTGIATATLYRRFAGSGSTQAFKAGEVASIAGALNVKPGDLYEGLGGRFEPEPPTPPAVESEGLAELTRRKQGRSRGVAWSTDEYLAA